MMKHPSLLLCCLYLALPALAAERPPAVWQLSEKAAAPSASRPVQSPATAQEILLQISPALASLHVGTSLGVPLPGGREALGRLAARRPSASGGQHYRIVMANERGGEEKSLLLHVGLNATYGRLWTDQGAFLVEPAPNGGTRLRPMPDKPPGRDLVRVPDAQHAPPTGKAPLSRAKDGSQAATGEGPNDDTLDFLYLYDASMIEEFGWGLTDLAASDLGKLQTALRRAGSAMQVELARFQFMDVPHEMGSEALLDSAFEQTETGIFADLRARVLQQGVDIVSLNRQLDDARDGFCGIAYLLSPLFDVLNRGGANGYVRAQLNLCHNSFTLAHETGHNLGLAHGLETDGSSGAEFDWARGFRIEQDFEPEYPILRQDLFVSIMAYGLIIDDDDEPSFSDPTVACPGRGNVCGIPRDPDNPASGADAAFSLRTHGIGHATEGRPGERLLSAVLPSSRFVATGTAATVFMTVINPGQVDGIGCVIEHHGPFRDSFRFRTTNPADNVPNGEPNQPTEIPAGGFRTFLLSITPGADLPDGVTFAPYAVCDNVPMALPIRGLNTVELGADRGFGPDLIADSATASPGTVDIPAGGEGVFAVATLNLGGPGRMSVQAVSLSPLLPAQAELCETNPQTGACIGPRSGTVTLDIGPMEAPTFNVFVRTEQVTPFDPRRRLQVQLRVNGVLRGATSVAVRDLGSLLPPGSSDDSFSLDAGASRTASLASLASGYHDRYEVLVAPTLGRVELDEATGGYTYTAENRGGADSFRWRAGNAAGWSASGTVRATVRPLAVPAVRSFRLEDDAGGRLRLELQEYLANQVEVERFVLVAPPPGEYTFDADAGLLSMDLPEAPGVLSFDFAAENESGRGGVATATLNLLAYDDCAPASLSPSRWIRRLEQVAVSTDGLVSLDEAAAIGEALCMSLRAERETNLVFTLRDGGDVLARMWLIEDAEEDDFGYELDLLQRPPLERFYLFHGQINLCKTAGRDRLTPSGGRSGQPGGVCPGF